MTEAERCPICGAELAAGESPDGLCPRCLLKAGLADSRASDLSAAQTTPSPPGGAGDAMDIARLAPLFPQLEIQRLLGRGGMGAVYLARQKALDRQVALKLLAPKPGLDAEFAERFGREARALARLSHPGIVAVYDFGQTEGLYYFLMEYVDGTSLREVMRRGKLPPHRALSLVPQICDALQYAHDEGIVHRDIKPENILLDRKGRLKIADFGLAKLIGAAEDEPLTGSHHIMGTRNYMAPEQLEHPKQVDHRADIYSLGVVFYEMLTGELPLGRFAPPSQKIHVDVRLDEVVLRALEKEPERRYQHASAIKTDIGDIRPTVDKKQAAPFEQPQGPFLLEERKGQPSHRELAALLAVFGGLVTWSSVGPAHPVHHVDPFGFIWVFFMIDGFFQLWLGYSFELSAPWTDMGWRGVKGRRWPVWVALALFLFWWKVSPETSSALQDALIAGFSLAVIIGAGVRVIVRGAGPRRTQALLDFQTVLMAFSAFPVLSPLDYFSWIYRFAGAKPGPNDALVVRLLFIAILAVLLGWKIQTHRAARRIAIPAPRREPRPKRAPSWAFFVDENEWVVNPRWVWFFVGVAVVLLVLVVVFSRIMA